MTLLASHFLSSDCWVLPSIGLAERSPVGLYCVLQQRSTPEVVLPLAEDINKLVEYLI